VNDSKSLLMKWKKDCESQIQRADKETVSTTKPLESTKIQNVKSKIFSSVAQNESKLNEVDTKPKIEIVSLSKDSSSLTRNDSSMDDNDDFDDEALFLQLTPTRRKIMDLFADQFKSNINHQIAKILAFSIEGSVNKLHNCDRDSKAYITKARSLSFNLKKNERLRLDIIHGLIKADQVAFLSASDLATDDMRNKRETAAKDAEMARRSDLYEITRSEILQANGIDPNAAGEFICRKCKGTKCSHYSMQTRSSDEPMTVFVCCLTCGKRWRE